MLAAPRISDRLVSRGFFASAFALSATALAFSGAFANTPADNLPAAPEKGLVAHYDFDEGDGTVLQDHSGHGLDGTLQGGAQWQTGVLGTSLYFNGTDAYVQLPADSSLLLDSFTVTAWIQPVEQGDSVRDDERVIYSNLESTAPPIRATGGTEFRFRYAQLNGVSAGAAFNGGWSEMFRPASLADGAWHMVGFSVAGGFGRLWIDGAQVGLPMSWGRISQPKSLPQIGACLRNWAAYGYFHGRIDEMRIYDRGLSAAEIAAVYASLGGKIPAPTGDGLIARYDFDEAAGTVLHDHSGHGFDGILHGGAAWKAGAHGSSLEFNGINAYVQLPSDSAFNAASFTVAAWIQPYEQGQGSDERVFYSNLAYTIGDSVDQGTEFRFRNGELEGVTGRLVYDGTYWSDMFRPAALADGAWHMVAFTVGQGYGRLWIDGVQAGAAEPWGEIGYPTPLPQIGACLRNQATSGWFHGRIDEMSIYGRALSADEIKSAYQSIAPPPPPQPQVLNLGIGKAFAKAGDTVWVPLRLANLGSATFSACQFVLRVDSAVARFIGIKTDSGLARNWALQGWNDARKDSIAVALGGAPVALGKSEGELLRFGFVIPSGARARSATDLTLEDIRFDEKGDLAVSQVPGRITVSPPPVLYGDVNGDGKIDIFDAQAILDYVVGFRSGPDSAAKFDAALADVSGSGNITSYDAALVFQYAIGLIGDFPVDKALGKRSAAAPLSSAALTIDSPQAAGPDLVYTLSGSGMSGLTAAEFRFQLPASVSDVREIHSSWFSDKAVSHFDPATHVLSVATLGEIPLAGDASGLLRITVATASGAAPAPMTLVSAYLNEGRLTGPGFLSAPLRSSVVPIVPASRAPAVPNARLSGNRIQFANLAGRPARVQAFDARGQRLWSQAWDHAPAAFDLPEQGWPRGLIWIRLSAPGADQAWLHLSMGPR